jgi:hypothetical protein
VNMDNPCNSWESTTVPLSVLQCDRCGRDLGLSYSVRNDQRICAMCRSILLERENVIVFPAFDSDPAAA